MAADVNGVPSWKVTPWRSLKVKTLLSGDAVQLVASAGSRVGVAVPVLYVSRPS